MIELEVKNGSITFVKPISLDQLSKAMLAYESLIKALDPEATVTYKDFTTWLMTTAYVKVAPAIKVKK